MSNPVRFPDTFRLQAATRSNPQGRRMSIRALAQICEVSYEHMRKIFRGEPSLSEDVNRRLCATLDVPEEEMWRVIVSAKLRRRFPSHQIARIRDALRGAERRPERSFLVKYSRTALAKAASKIEAARLVRTHRAEPIHVERVWPVEVDDTGATVIGPAITTDETIVAGKTEAATLCLGHLEARLLAACLEAANDKVGSANVMPAWQPTSDEFEGIHRKLATVIEGTIDPTRS